MNKETPKVFLGIVPTPDGIEIVEDTDLGLVERDIEYLTKLFKESNAELIDRVKIYEAKRIK